MSPIDYGLLFLWGMLVVGWPTLHIAVLLRDMNDSIQLLNRNEETRNRLLNENNNMFAASTERAAAHQERITELLK